ncbi:biopolymer transporter ExbD [uncultured Aquitalea sp.]|uniref:biopolymer transporter ExbD n=1 Tax=uncultured Aquitalea sp. TaxID=540272 RepID=UPI0025D7FD48|nr:biopolymer transporter ExbD [uncultured Aquitalea sp.]
MLNRRPRRQMNQMNVVPYIDVMLVLLVIFMVTAPMFTPGVIDVPSVSRAAALDTRPVEVVLQAENRFDITDNDQKTTVSSLEELLAHFKGLPKIGDRPVAITADGNLKYQDVVRVADKLHEAGIKRVALTVKAKN